MRSDDYAWLDASNDLVTGRSQEADECVPARAGDASLDASDDGLRGSSAFCQSTLAQTGTCAGFLK